MKKKEISANKRRRTNSKATNKIFAPELFSRRRLTVLIGGLIVLIAAVFTVGLNFGETRKAAAKDVSEEIENALYTRQEFFGAEAVVPLPTNEARENLARLATDSAENPLLLKPLAELDEKLEKYDEAEKSLIRLSEIDAANADALAAFYDRRAAFDKEAEVLRKVLFTTEPSKRAAVFERLIDLARMHDLKAYLNADFYAAVIKENPNVRLIFENLIDKLKEEKNYAEALKFVRQAKAQFPERRVALLEKEIAILLESNQTKEAEAVYAADFDPFWSSDEADRFYEFLSEHDRLREYGAELKAKFRANPADFETGVRLALFQNHDYVYDNDDITPIISKIEAAKKIWTTAELVTATKLLLQSNDGAAASRFLYTLYLREDFQKNSEQRAAVLYQLFQMFSEAENQKLPLTKGNLRFYSDIARADQNPGITTGILSLILSDTKPQEQLDQQETTANKLFNRAAAYRIFEAYKKESPKASPQLGQMYLDLTNYYLKTEKPDAAEKILNEFAERYENSTDYPNVALKLADGFSAMKNEAKAREIYQKVLDFLGKQKKSLAPKMTATDDDSESADGDADAPATDSDSYYNDQAANNFNDFSVERKTPVAYDEVLEIFVSSLAKEKKTAEILALYSAEIGKYPNEEWLYERRLTWLEQTNLTDEKLELYKNAIAQFKTNDWRDKLARFFVREKRDGDFAAFSEDLIGKLNDAEIQDYLTQFVNGNASTSKQFEKQLYLKLYQTAHRRFPHNQAFAVGLLTFYRAHEMETEWRT
ncbi:MAG: hypothetical protein M3T96_05630, partial [Acidobacteriota bacterium]|nr:hypothetical protein [Acidobacteriota bacterium]